jgi:23S rRNA-/tRNA-specific pseudouridylate synthase
LKKRWRTERPPAKAAKGTPKSAKGTPRPGKGAPKPYKAERVPAGRATTKQTPPAQQERRTKTLDRVLSKLGVCSRTESREWIEQGRLQVNGQTVRDPEQWVDLDRDRVALDGKPVRAEQKTYLVLNKPKGYLTSYTDPDGRKTIYDLLKTLDQWV